MAPIASTTFGSLLKQLRKRAGMTQADLAAAVGYSIPFISNLELNQRLPDLQSVMQLFVPALGLQGEPHAAASLLEQAALARGERLPASVTMHHTTQVAVHEEFRQTQFVQTPTLLPAPPTELIGRANEVNQLCNRLLGHSGRLLTLVGPPGIGKTTLALAVAAHLQLHYRDGAVFLPLAAISDSITLATTILVAVGSTDLSPPKTKLIEFMRRKTMLMVLDNLEQISEAAPLIADLVAECPGLCILATSRERLHLRAEQRYKVPPLDLAPAVELFVQRAQSVDFDFVLTPHNQPTLEAICQRLDCLPLAIELCAAQIDLLSPTQLLAQLQARPLDLLVDGARDLPPQHRTLRAAIGRSYALLNETERLLFRSLGVFMGGCALEEIAVVHDTSVVHRDLSVIDSASHPPLLSTLHSLIGKSLVRAETISTGTQRFLLLETIREFALEQLRAHGEEADLRQRHYAAYLQLFRIGDSYLRGPKAATWMVRLESEQENLRSTLQWKLDTQQPIDAAWLLIAVHHFWFMCGQRYEDSQWLVKLLPYRHQMPINLQLMTLISFYGSAFGLEGFHALDCYKNELMELLDDCADVRLQAAAWYFLVFTSTSSQTINMIEKFVASARSAYSLPPLDPKFCMAADRDYILAANLWGYTRRLIDQGEFARAMPVATETLQLLRTQGNQLGIADSLGSLGRLAIFQGDLTKAYTYFHEAVTIAKIFHNRYIQCASQLSLGLVTLYRGETMTALQLFSESLRFSFEMQDMFLVARSYAYLAELSLLEGDLEQANHWWTQSLAYPTFSHQNSIEAFTRILLAARLATAQQQHISAATLFGYARRMYSHLYNVIFGPSRTLADAALATVQATLEPALFAEAFSVGQQMSLEDASATILAPKLWNTLATSCSVLSIG